MMHAKEGAVSPRASNRPRVIITDDEMHIRELFKVMMTSMDIEVAAVARNGQEAVELYRKIRPHLILLDINMPGKTGDEALEEIMAEFPHAFVIMLTAVSDLDTVKKCLKKGASNYILKDTPISEMKQIIQETWNKRLEALRKRHSPPASAKPAPKAVAHGARPGTGGQVPAGQPAQQGGRPVQRPGGAQPGQPAKRPVGPQPRGGQPAQRPVSAPPGQPVKRPGAPARPCARPWNG